MVRYAKLPISFNARDMQNELADAAAGWRPHINTYHYSGSWTVLPLRSPGGDHQNIVPELLGKETEFRDTVFMAGFSSVKELLKSLLCEVTSVRLLNLQAGAEIKEHRDNELAFEKGEARLHFPVATNNNVKFYSEGERIFLQEGECWYLNANLPHRVLNDSDADRIHLVVDCKVNDWLKEVILSSSQISYKEQTVNRRDMLNMISSLRAHHTEPSNTLADTLEQRLKEAIANNLVT